MISVDKDALLLAMCDKLPPLGEVFTSGDQERWLDAMRAILAFLYPPEWVPEARRKAREAAAAHFPTITAPQHGRITIGVPPDGFEPVLILPAEIERVILDRNLTAKEEPSTTSADAVDDESGGEETDDSGAGPAPDTSSVPSAGSPPESAPSTPSSGVLVPEIDTPIPETLAERLERQGIKSDVPVPGRIAPPQPTRIVPPRDRKRHFRSETKIEMVRRCVREGVEVVEDEELIAAGTLRKWMREYHDVVSATEQEIEVERRRQVLDEGHPSVAELEAEKKTPVPPRMMVDVEPRAAELAARPPVQWPTAPIERRPVDHAAVLRSQADQV